MLDKWKSEVPIARTYSTEPPAGWKLEKALFATPTIVLFENGKEVSRYTGYNGEQPRFWKWLGFHLLTPEQQKIAFEQGTERPGTGSHLDEKRPGTFVDPITGAALFRSDTKFDSGTGWPSFFNPLPGALTEHVDSAHGMRRVEVQQRQFRHPPRPRLRRRPEAQRQTLLHQRQCAEVRAGLKKSAPAGRHTGVIDG